MITWLALGCDNFSKNENLEKENAGVLAVLATSLSSSLSSSGTDTSIPITTHTISGNVTGNLFGGTVTLQLNGANNVSRSALGSFTFGTTLQTNQNYTVTVLTQPASANCGVTSNGNGKIVSSNITAVIDCNACGDGVVPSYQPCDDGNLVAGDGCSVTCTVESGYTCTG
jgi:cysteine-rich repeat protein